MGVVTKIRPPDKDTLDWLSKMGTKYSLSDTLTSSDSPLVEGVLDWSKRLMASVKANISRTKSQATKALYQSVAVLPIFSTGTNIKSQIQAEDYIDFLDKGVNGTQRSRNSPFSFKNDFVGRDMLNNLQVYIASKPIPLQSHPGKTKRELNKQVAFAMAKKLKQEGIKPRPIYTNLVKPEGKYVTELKEIVGKNVAGAVTATLLSAFKR